MVKLLPGSKGLLCVVIYIQVDDIFFLHLQILSNMRTLKVWYFSGFSEVNVYIFLE